MSKTILAIDIGSTKISAAIAEVGSGTPAILGHGTAKSQGVKKGVITNIELTTKSIKKALNDAKRISGSNISSAIVSISNAYTKSLNSTGVVNIPHKDITMKEIERVMKTALYNANIPNEYDVIHVLPYNFTVDDQDYIEDPHGMNASRMEVDVNIIMTQKSNLANLQKAVRSAGVEIEGVVLGGYASTIATMGHDDLELGAVVIDLGGQTSNLVVHSGNSIRYTDFLAVGSNHVTNDLSMALHTPLESAEKVKCKYANLAESSSEVIELPIIGDEENRNNVSLEVVHTVAFARVEEALVLLARSLEKSALREQLGAGVILTGGMTKLKGFRELAQSIFDSMPVRISTPMKLGGMFEELKDPAYASVIGLLLYQAGKHTEYEINYKQELLHSKNIIKESLSDIASMSTEIEPTENKIKKEPVTVPTKEEEENTIIFDDLPTNGKNGKNGMGKKLVNWAKQLF